MSRLLQVFLFIALIVSVAAFVANRRTHATIDEMETVKAIQLKVRAPHRLSLLAHPVQGDEAFARKNYVQAVAEYRLALQETSQPELHQKLGRALLAEGNPDAAFAEFKQAIKNDPTRWEVYTAWGQGLISIGKPDEAARLYQEALKSNPQSGLLHYELAAALRDQQKNAEAVRDAALAGGNADQAESAAAQISRLVKEALQECILAKQMGLELPVFWCGYGQLLLEQGEYSEAEACLSRALKKDPAMTAAYSALAWAEFQQGKYAEAIGHYESVLTLMRDDPETLNHLARIYVAATNTDFFSPRMAVQLATRACDATTHQNAGYLDTLARSYAAGGDFLEAISWEDQAAHRATQLGDRALAAQYEARYGLLIDHKTD